VPLQDLELSNLLLGYPAQKYPHIDPLLPICIGNGSAIEPSKVYYNLASFSFQIFQQMKLDFRLEVLNKEFIAIMMDDDGLAMMV